MKVAVFGGTGFVGSYLVETLLRHGHSLRLLVRPGSEEKVLPSWDVTVIRGEVQDLKAVRETLAGSQTVVYGIGVLRPPKLTDFEELHYAAARKIMDLALEEGVSRFLLISALGVKADGTLYQRTKFKAEEYLKTTGLEWTIFRPSLIFGPPRGRMEFCTRMKQELFSGWLPAPLFFSGFHFRQAGTVLFAPIHVQDVADFVVQSMERPDTVGTILELGGVDQLRWSDLIQVLGRVLDKRKFLLPVPEWGLRFLAAMLDRFSWFPITRIELRMFLEGNTCDSGDLYRTFGITPRRFTPEYLEYLVETEGS